MEAYGAIGGGGGTEIAFGGELDGGDGTCAGGQLLGETVARMGGTRSGHSGGTGMGSEWRNDSRRLERGEDEASVAKAERRVNRPLNRHSLGGLYG